MIDKAREISSILCEDALQKGMDGEHGGIFNRYDGDQLISDEKDWWPQAEGVLALLKLYSYTQNKKYLNHATRLIDYIEHTFSDPVYGEWYTTVSKEGTPFNDRLKTNFWKSLYHNVRYCIEAANELKLHYS